MVLHSCMIKSIIITPRQSCIDGTLIDKSSFFCFSRDAIEFANVKKKTLEKCYIATTNRKKMQSRSDMSTCCCRICSLKHDSSHMPHPLTIHWLNFHICCHRFGAHWIEGPRVKLAYSVVNVLINDLILFSRVDHNFTIYKTQTTIWFIILFWFEKFISLSAAGRINFNVYWIF